MYIARGEGNMVLELQAEDDRLTGYARPMLENVEVVDWEDGVLETLSEPFHLLRESTLGVILSALTHPESEEVATEVEFTGEVRSEERRVGKEGRSEREGEQERKKERRKQNVREKRGKKR